MLEQNELQAIRNMIKEDLQDFKEDLSSMKNEMNTRFDKMDERLDKVDERLDKVDKRLNKVEAEVKALHQMDNTIFSELERVHMVLLDKTRALEKKIV